MLNLAPLPPLPHFDRFLKKPKKKKQQIGDYASSFPPVAWLAGSMPPPRTWLDSSRVHVS
jgi:hypothetical protein